MPRRKPPEVHPLIKRGAVISPRHISKIVVTGAATGFIPLHASVSLNRMPGKGGFGAGSYKNSVRCFGYRVWGPRNGYVITHESEEPGNDAANCRRLERPKFVPLNDRQIANVREVRFMPNAHKIEVE